jgi:hypothetical protein
MRPRREASALAAAAVRKPAEGDALLRARRKFALNRRAHLRSLVVWIVMSVIAVGCLVTWFVLRNSQDPLWPWAIGAVVAIALAVHSFAKQVRFEDCPHCKAILLGYGLHCPYCGVGIVGNEHACPSCRASYARPPRLRRLSFCSSCGTDLLGSRRAPAREAVEPEDLASS